jgi:uncharacterized protein (TIGR03086 family)
VSDDHALAALEDALGRTGALIDAVPAGALHDPTPCASFDVRQLIEHIARDLRMFAATASGDQGRSEPAGTNDGDYGSAAKALVESWRAGGVEGRTVHGRIGDFPATWAVSQQIADVIVHGWDVAKATGQRASFDDDTTVAALSWAKENLQPQFRGDEQSGKSFGPEVEVADDAAPLDRLVAFFGRDPAWTPPG